MGFIDELKARYWAGSMLTKLIYVNVAVFLVLRLAAAFAFLSGASADWLLALVEVPSHWQQVLYRPWTLLTYMVAHYDVLHIIFNMLWFYWLGMMFLDYFTPKQLTGLYVLGGLGGAAAFVLAGSLMPAFRYGQSYLIGASASILAIVVAVAVTAPRRPVRLFVIGDVQLKWVAIVTLLIDFLGIDAGNAGGHIAHLGGAVVGLVYGLGMRRGTDVTSRLNAFIDRLCSFFKRKGRGVGQPVGGRAYHYSAPQRHDAKPETPTEAEIDVILDKIKRSGYSALSDAERDTLFRASARRSTLGK